ncbi:hypothetical protein N825_00950 [Skermanella stibiiresistens SB22]|uniref:Uncharacterized protein n=1 Tax=Skermanella stibiiresistens SB22 TaxID=1385369 RepID=W9HDP1_9PROT|nr:hypothetical protein N825_00950 [Skermanella stibiiresistens SB22]
MGERFSQIVELDAVDTMLDTLIDDRGVLLAGHHAKFRECTLVDMDGPRAHWAPQIADISGFDVQMQRKVEFDLATRHLIPLRAIVKIGRRTMPLPLVPIDYFAVSLIRIKIVSGGRVFRPITHLVLVDLRLGHYTFPFPKVVVGIIGLDLYDLITLRPPIRIENKKVRCRSQWSIGNL